MQTQLPEVTLSIHTVCLWLIEFLDTSPPRLIRDVKREADVHGIPPQLLNSAAKALPLIRRPKVVRGPWTWQLPQPAELVRVCYFCPVIGCGKTSEGWMEFRLSRILFSAGLVRYVTSLAHKAGCSTAWRSRGANRCGGSREALTEIEES